VILRDEIQPFFNTTTSTWARSYWSLLLSLGHWIKSGSINPKQLTTYLNDVSTALEYSHSHNILNCDVKPSNMVLFYEDRKSPRAMLIDWKVISSSFSFRPCSSHLTIVLQPRSLAKKQECPRQNGGFRSFALHELLLDPSFSNSCD
jgi:serine/threonine protein kinase